MTDKNQIVDFYHTIEKKERAEIKIKGSKFIASISSVKNKEEAMNFVNSIRSEFYDATHNCFAYRFGWDGLEFRSSDDGEPSGSAGKPILFEIKKYGVSDIAVVVTRFYGGTKLGVGGLARAYGGSAAEAFSLCNKKIINRTIPVKVFCIYEDISMIKRLIEETAISFTDYYADSVEFVAEIPLSKVEAFQAKIIDMTRGRSGTQIQQKS